MKKGPNLPDDWNEMSAVGQICWLSEHYSKGEDDEHGYAEYDTESMPKDVYEAYLDLIVERRKLKEQGILLD